MIQKIFFILLFSSLFYRGLFAFGVSQYIPKTSHVLPYIEICFKGEKMEIDIHESGGRTEGGNCEVGDRGFLLEREERGTATWFEALKDCSSSGMRLPTAFEWQASCYKSAELFSGVHSDTEKEALVNMVGNWEWAGNSSHPMEYYKNYGETVPIVGQGGCSYGSWDWVAYPGGGDFRNSYRCALSSLDRPEEKEDGKLLASFSNLGIGYQNRIVLFEPRLPYTEVCFKNGDIRLDIHLNGNESTKGGLCVPGDVGFLIEREVREKVPWYKAKETCLRENMRLPEIFEWNMGCENRARWGLEDTLVNGEWASNIIRPLYFPINTSNEKEKIGEQQGGAGLGATVLGRKGCDDSFHGWMGHFSGFIESAHFRCVR